MKNFKSSLHVFFLFLLTTLHTPLYADIVHLKNGADFEGKITEKDRKELTLEVDLGKLRFSQSDVDWFIEGTEEEITNKRRVAGYFEKASGYYSNKQYHLAINQYHKAIYLLPTEPSLYNNLGVCYAKIHQIGKAVENFRKASQLQPMNEIFSQNFEYARQVYEKKVQITQSATGEQA